MVKIDFQYINNTLWSGFR